MCKTQSKGLNIVTTQEIDNSDSDSKDQFLGVNTEAIHHTTLHRDGGSKVMLVRQTCVAHNAWSTHALLLGSGGKLPQEIFEKQAFENTNDWACEHHHANRI